MKQREDDYIDELQTCSSHDNILFISNKGIMYKLKCYELPEGSKASRGTNIVNLLELGEGEKIAAMIKTADFDEGKYIVMVTKNGKIKRTPLTSYRNVRKNGLIAIGLDEGDEIAGVRMTFGDNEVIVATHNGYAIRIRETDIREMSRVAHGVKAIKLRGSDYVVSMARRLGIRIKAEDGTKYFAHTLNNTVVAPPRMLIAFLENNLNADGTVNIPEPLRMYMGGKDKITK
jgi:DNA gyrase subunit A